MLQRENYSGSLTEITEAALQRSVRTGSAHDAEVTGSSAGNWCSFVWCCRSQVICLCLCSQKLSSFLSKLRSFTFLSHDTGNPSTTHPQSNQHPPSTHPAPTPKPPKPHPAPTQHLLGTPPHRMHPTTPYAPHHTVCTTHHLLSASYSGVCLPVIVSFDN